MFYNLLRQFLQTCKETLKSQISEWSLVCRLNTFITDIQFRSPKTPLTPLSDLPFKSHYLGLFFLSLLNT